MKKGFTLAEVLITLAVIGVVAALAIPALIQNTNESQYKTAWKKTFADMDQATKRILIDNSGSLKNICPDDDHDCFKNKYADYLNHVKSCNTGEFLGNCWHDNNNSSKRLNGNFVTTWGDRSGLILSNGTLLYIAHGANTSSCTNSINGTDSCGAIQVDVNGFKGPNTIGKDIYALYVLENSIKPWGGAGDTILLPNTCLPGDTSLGNTGYGCSALYLYKE